jgi:hypothetical protein
MVLARGAVTVADRFMTSGFQAMAGGALKMFVETSATVTVVAVVAG